MEVCSSTLFLHTPNDTTFHSCGKQRHSYFFLLGAGAISLTTLILYIDIQVVSHIIIVLPLLSSKYISE